MREKQDPNFGTVLEGGRDTPFKSRNKLAVTQDEANGIKAFIRELKPGIYIKCSNCEKFKYGAQTITLGARDQILCEGCAGA